MNTNAAAKSVVTSIAVRIANSSRGRLITVGVVLIAFRPA